MFVIDLESEQNSLDICQTAKGCVPCYDVVPAEFLTKITNIKKVTERFVRAQKKKNITNEEKQTRS